MTELALEPVEVLTDGGWSDGRLVRADGRLAAVLVRLAEHDGEGDGRWFLEAGFGQCGTLAITTPPPFAGLPDAQRWIAARLAPHRLGE